MSRPADWWTSDGVRHAFPLLGFPFRSFCGEVRWSTALTRDYEAPECIDCLAAEKGEQPAPVMRVPARDPMDPELKKHVYTHRRRWNGTTYR